MPTMRVQVSSTTSDSLSNIKFSVVPPGGAILNVWISCVTGTDSWGLSVGDKDVVVDGTLSNVEASADVIAKERDQEIFDEVVGAGQIFFPVTVTTQAQFTAHLRYMNP